ncbi:MAG TPA: hypothetical protein VK203_22780 [Nostocaceae cyanobacterium]|nr:hypothetical protein [Nostocaceae cyanobacterium]
MTRKNPFSTLLGDKKPNKKQRQWLNEFTKGKQGVEIVKARDLNCRYFSFVIRWREPFSLDTFPNTEPGDAWTVYEIYLELTPAAVPREMRQKTIEVVYPHCALRPKGQREFLVQTALPLSQMLELPTQKAPKKSSRTKLGSESQIEQLQLPVDSLGQKILDIRLQNGGEIESRQALLAQTQSHYSLQFRKVFQFNQAIIDLLRAVEATTEEWESAELLLQVIGEAGVIKYIEGIPVLRELQGKQATTVPVSSSRHINVSESQSVNLI